MNKETFESYIIYRKILGKYMWIRYLLVSLFLVGSILAHMDGDRLFAVIIGAGCIYNTVIMFIKHLKIDEIDKRLESTLELSLKDNWKKYHPREINVT